MKALFAAALVAAAAASAAAPSPFGDWRAEAPGRRHKIVPADLPEPYATESANNGPSLIKRPDGAWPKAPKGYAVELYSNAVRNPRQIRRAPNGDLFVAESGPGRIKVFRGITADGKPEAVEIFASGLSKPFGIAFYPPGPEPKFVFVGDTDAILRFPYANGDTKASAPPRKIADLPGGGFVDGGHWTRDLAFSRDGKTLFVSVGSRSNVNDPDEHPEEKERADVLAFDPEGGHRRVYASGLRNPVGLAVNPATGELWTSVNERDRLGDDLVPDYITHIKEGGFYGWPWYYIGAHPDPRLKGKRPELKDETIVPDVLIQPHNASLGVVFSEAGDLFAAEHGSWNRSTRTGYEVIRVPLKSGRSDGSYEDFLTGFVTNDGQVWGRPVGVAFAADGSLMVTDDGGNAIWRVRRAAR